MAKRKKEAALNYAAEIRKLKEEGPARLYFLWGEEEYLRDSFLNTLREICCPDGGEDFQIRVFKEAQIDPAELRYAIDTLPFFSERSLIEIRDLDYNKLGDADRLIEVLSDIPDYCTVAFRLNQGEEPNGKSKLVKFLRANAAEIRFTVQDQNMLFRWITRRFAFYGKGVEMEAAQRLIYLSGDQMKALIPEIEKIATYARGEKVLAERRFNTASGLLADLLEQRDTSVPAILSLLSNQFRRLLISADAGDTASVMELCNIKYEFMARRLLNSARNFRPEQLRHAIELCENADYRLKSEGADEKVLLKETLMRIILEVSDV